MRKLRLVQKRARAVKLVGGGVEHAQLLHDIFAGANTRKYSPVSNPSVAELARSLARSGRSFLEKSRAYRFFGEYDSVLFGTFILKDIDWEGLEAEVGFSLLEEWQGRGLGSALVCKCVAKVFAETEIERLWATVSVTNHASRRLMRRIGFGDCGPYGKAFLINGRPVEQIVYRLGREEAKRLGVVT